MAGKACRGGSSAPFWKGNWVPQLPHLLASPKDIVRTWWQRAPWLERGLLTGERGWLREEGLQDPFCCLRVNDTRLTNAT